MIPLGVCANTKRNANFQMSQTNTNARTYETRAMWCFFVAVYNDKFLVFVNQANKFVRFRRKN